MPAPFQRLIKEHKLDRDSLQAAFAVKGLGGDPKREKVKALVNTIQDIVRDGIRRNRRDYRLFKAMDWAYDAPFYQISYTQLRGLLSNKPDDKKVLETINSWGLTHLLADEVDATGKVCCDAAGLPKKIINLPVFTNIFVPLVMAYVTIRWAKLFNERNLVPLYKYEPVQYTKENRARCEILTQVVQKQSSWFDYASDEAQSILQTLLYGYCINFPREAWFTERQLNEEGKEKIVREGLRFNMPHPSRVYYDLYNRLSTLNANSGCEYAGYWELCRYKEINDHPLYWNKDQISFGSLSWFDIGRSDFLEEVFPCSMSFPDLTSRGGVGGTGGLDRETDAAAFYTSSDYNNATLKTQHFQKLIPAEHDLGDYKYPVWMRFIMASDNAVIWAEPLAFDRLPAYMYDADCNRSRFNSLALQVIPFQDHIGNLFSQWIAAVRENLRNPVFYDKDKVPHEAMLALQNLGNKKIDGRVFIPYSATENYRFNANQREAFHSPQLTHHNTAEVSTIVAAILDMLERVLQFSAQELGQPASHEQTAEESRIIFRHTSNRVELTGSFIDRAVYAKKVMLYDALMAHADDNITVGISSAFAATEEEFKKLMDKLGFTISDDGTYDPQDPDAMRTVKGTKKHLALEAFASTRDAATRIDNPAIADAMSKIFLAVAQNEALVQSVGVMQLVELLNQIITAAGLPKEFRLRGKNIDQNAPPEQQGEQLTGVLTEFSKQVKEAIDQASKEVLQQAGEGAAQAIGQVMSQASEQLTAVAEATAQQAQINQAQQRQLEQLAQALGELNQKIDTVAAVAAPPAPPMMPGPLPPEMAPV